MRRARRRLWPVLAMFVVSSVLLLGLFPTRTYLAQRASLGTAQERLAVLTSENESLEARVDLLGTDAEIARLAREQYNLVLPGEEVYGILPTPPKPVELPSGWPFTLLHPLLPPNVRSAQP